MGQRKPEALHADLQLSKAGREETSMPDADLGEVTIHYEEAGMGGSVSRKRFLRTYNSARLGERRSLCRMQTWAM